MRTTLVTLALSTLLVTGCTTLGARVQKGMNLYDRTDFTGAMDQFAAVGVKERDMNQKGAIRYLVYRGLTHYRLGQRSEAYLFLSRGHEAYSKGTPAWLPARTVGEMDRALNDLASNAPDSAPPQPDAVPPEEEAPPPATTIILVPDAPPPEE